MTDEQRVALWAKRQSIGQTEMIAGRLIEQQSPFRSQALARLERLRREYDEMYAEATGS
jgi:hypothetical protein